MTYIYGLRNLSHVNESTFMRKTPINFFMPREISIFSTQVSFIYFSSSFLLTKWRFYKQKKTYTSIVLQFVSYGDYKVFPNLVLPTFWLDVINIQRYFISNFFLFFNRHIPKIGLNRHIPIIVDHKLPQRCLGYIHAPSPHDLPRPRFYH